MKFMVVVFCMVAFVVIGEASAATYYVAKTGNDANSGIEASPWLMIQKYVKQMIKTKEQRKVRIWTRKSSRVLSVAVALFVFFFGIPTSYAVVTFANNGLSEPFYWLTRPTAVYYDGKTYVVWHGTGYDPYITYYDHTAKTWAQVKRVGDNPMVDNGHGAPAMTIDGSGYIHVFYGATIAGGFPLKHAISDSPGSISAFTVQPNIGMYNYPKPINIGNFLHLFVMGPSDAAYLSDLVWDGYSWNSARPPLIHGNSGDNTYVGFMEYNNNKIHVTWTYAYSQGGRRHVFYAYLNLVDGNMYSITGRNLGTTIDTTEAETYCMVRNTGADETNTPSMHFDSNGYPQIIFPEGAGTTWKFYHTRWDGSAWTAPTVITTTDDRFNYEDFKIKSVTNVTAYLTTSGAPGPGGDIEQWHWNGIAWSKVSTILSESASGKPLGGANIPYNFNPELDLVFSQFLDDIFTSDTLKIYANLIVPASDITPICTTNWQCESPLNGYESDGCGNRRVNSQCDLPIPARCLVFQKWKIVCTMIYQFCTTNDMPSAFCNEQKNTCEKKVDELIEKCRRVF